MAGKDSFNFTKAYEELEAIVVAFESGNVDLERDLPKFERGLKLAKECRQRLRELENHVKRIEKTFQTDERPPLAAAGASHDGDHTDDPVAARPI